MSKYFSVESKRLNHLNGIRLADFHQRVAAFLVDASIAIAILLMCLLAFGFVRWLITTSGDVQHPYHLQISLETSLGKFLVELLAPVLYFGLATWRWNGCTIGKRLVKIRVVSIVHERMTLWHSIERALGYGAAALEFGFGFVAFFIDPNRRCAQDRLAETIVVDERKHPKAGNTASSS